MNLNSTPALNYVISLTTNRLKGQESKRKAQKYYRHQEVQAQISLCVCLVHTLGNDVFLMLKTACI